MSNVGVGVFSGVTLIDRKEIGAMVDRSDGMIDDGSLMILLRDWTSCLVTSSWLYSR